MSGINHIRTSFPCYSDLFRGSLSRSCATLKNALLVDYLRWLLPVGQHDSAQRCAQHLLNAITALALPHVRSPSGRISISIGGATSATNADGDAMSLVETADRALYRAKREGRDRACFD